MNYEPQLRAATAAALEAGALLREEFHRPGGPRGERGHAFSDREAESLIRGRLNALYPDYGVLGEELGVKAAAPGFGGYIWVVDPNDGTESFQDGIRGSSVSIALIRDRQPVLGVVYAYNAPDDGGDLFTWAEGCGQVQRNGKPVDRSWPAWANPRHVVLLSPYADKKPRANVQAVAPMRYRCVTSIAHRLALVAAGEGDAAITLRNPRDWDYAAGHALLIGAGGDLYDAQGAPICYAPQGGSVCGGRCFGGSWGLIRNLINNDWEHILKTEEREPDKYDLAWPAPGRACRDNALLSRAQGAMLGQACGDALGAQVENDTLDELFSAYPEGVRIMEDGGSLNTLAGQPTDDTEMALMLARSIVMSGKYDPEAAATAYAWWYGSGPFDIGYTTETALRPAFTAHEDGMLVFPAAVSSGDPKSQANGALMRVSSLAVHGAMLPTSLVRDMARCDATITHSNRVCQDANAIYAATLAEAVRTGAPPENLYGQALEWATEWRVDESILHAIEAAASSPPEDLRASRGWVLLALQNAFFQMLNAPSLVDGVVNTIMSGGDADTNAAIAGALLGAVHGRESIPLSWRDSVLTCRPMRAVPGCVHARPPAFWPVDLLYLAELLVTAK